MSCSCLYSLLVSHQRMANRSNFATSAGSTMSWESGLIASTLIIFTDSLLPRGCHGEQFGFIECRERTLFEQMAARPPHIGDLVAAAGIAQLRARMIQRLGLNVAEVHGGDVGGLAGRERAGFIVEAQRLGAVERRHTQRGGGGQGAGVAGHGLG